MTSDKGIYNVTPREGVIRKACFKQYGAGWEQPTADEVATLVRHLGITWSQIAEFVGQGSARAARRWLQPEGTSNVRKIPYASWRLLVERYARQEIGEPVVLDLSGVTVSKKV